MLARVRISELWGALGGGPLRHGRGRAFWRKGDGYNVSLDDAKAAWYDFRDGIGGGLLDLVEKARDCDRKAALKWLAGFCGVALDSKPLTPAEGQLWARAKCEGPALARRAGWWLWARKAQLDERKAAAVTTDHVDVDALAAAAQEHYRLQTASAAGVIAAYRKFLVEHPADCARLTAAGQAHDGTCREIVGAIIDKTRADQEELSRAVV
jgi:hypothetical protein